MADEKDQWYSNKELHEMITGLKVELVETRRVVRAYNGLRQQLNDVCEAVEIIKAEGTGKNKLAGGIAMTIGIVGTLIGIAGGILAIASVLK